MKVILSILRFYIFKLLRLNYYYISKVKGNKKWASVSYIDYVFANRWNKKFMSSHQALRETIKIVEVLNDLGYNVYLSDYRSYKVPNIKFDLVFGNEPNFTEVAKVNPKALKIYYATGAYAAHMIKWTKKRTDEFNAKYKANYPYQRIPEDYEQFKYADKILQIGSKYTIETYPEDLRGKITTIHQSCQLDKNDIDILKKDYASNKDILWLGSSGTILKGLDLVIECLAKHPDINLHVAGYADEKFKEVCKASQMPNIIFHGFMDICSDDFKYIVANCNFMIYPSCSEGGMPGSVICSMYYGLIPIVSRWAADDNLLNIGGFILDDLTVDSIEKYISVIKSMSIQEIESRSISCHKYSLDTYNLGRFGKELKKYFQNVH